MNQVTFECKDRRGVITLNRPDKKNALDDIMMDGLKNAFQQANDDDKVKVVVLRAAGSVFCAGMDLGYLKRMQGFSFDENLRDSSQLKSLFEQIYYFPKPVIAQVQGTALAGGCGLVTMCDFAFSVPDATFGYTEVKIGFVPALVMPFLIRRIGQQRAMQLLLSGEIISAEKAQSLGLIYQCCRESTLETEVTHFAEHLVNNNATTSMMTIKSMIREIQDISFSDSLSFAARQNALARETLDCKRGIDAFLNKRKLSW